MTSDTTNITDTTDTIHLLCPECGEKARRQPPSDWRLTWLTTPDYSHLDGEPLCPVVGSDGYEPAQPVPARPTSPTTPTSMPASTPVPGVGGLFRFPAPMHRARPRGCQWCEPEESQVANLREEHPTDWVLHVLAEHVPVHVAGQVYVRFALDVVTVAQVEVSLHNAPWADVDLLAEALDLFPDRAGWLRDSEVSVVHFGADGDPVNLIWFTPQALGTVKELLTLGARPDDPGTE